MVKPNQSSSPSSQPEGRLREHPEQRFAQSQERFELSETIQELHREPSGQHGHKQINLFKHGPASLALFHFEPGSKFDDHVVDGAVFIQVLCGRLTVKTPEGDHQLKAGSLLRLAPGITHSVEAAEHSDMLLTICLEGPGSHS